jgi:CheY-like chemotaxis protein
MSIDEFVKVLDSLSKLLGVLTWPALLLFVLVRFGPALKEFFASLGEFTLKGGGLEASVKRKQAEATAALTAATAAKPGVPKTPEAAASEARDVASVVADFSAPSLLRKAARSVVLWVDDRPENQAYERRALEALGIRVFQVPSTESALEFLKKQKVDVIISDMSRPPDDRAGYTLLDSLRQQGKKTPFVIYSGSGSAEHLREARSRGALGSTNRVTELYEYVLSAIARDA